MILKGFRMSEKRPNICLVVVLQLFFSIQLYAQKQPVYARHGMVVSEDRIASEVGMEVLRKGGNAVDAAVATAFALAVVNPEAGNIGGGGFMIIKLSDGTTTAIDYREKAPMAAHKAMFLDENGNLIKGLNHRSYLAVGVPGTVAGLTLALEKFGTVALAELMKPAVTLAERGFTVPHYMGRHFRIFADEFQKYPASANVFFKADGQPYQAGDLFVQKDLAATLRRISKQGREGFYSGKTAEFIERDMAANGGLITKKDLAAYQAVVRTPITVDYRGYTITSMSPPSSGGTTLAVMLNILEAYDLGALGHNSAAYVHLLAEAMRRAYSVRAFHLGDPDFNPDMPVEKLISKAFAARLRQDIDLNTASKSDPANFAEAHESTETTHFSVVDAQGNAVSNTFTIEEIYGSKIIAAGAGFLYNNEMGDFNALPGRTDSTGLIGTLPNLVMPQKRMLSSMTPTIVSKDGQVLMLTGARGGRTIINTVLQTILNVVDFGMNIYEAVDAPRFHHQWLPDRIQMEKRGFSLDTITRLHELGHRVSYRSALGAAMLLHVDPETGVRTGGSDPRSSTAAAVGY